uniref:alpha/beta fold hydrolase n=1 Tax=Herbidospora sakaeratensis TaxID=564415 RepID=UPI0007808DD3|nr:alpha/beta hydrolase [Herbidospora sakaeratensis]
MSPRRFVNGALPALVLLAVTVAACGETGPELHLIDNDGHRLAFYVTPGSDATIVLDSGGGESAAQWTDLVPKLHAATGATVIAYDRAGLGKSDVVPGPWRVESAVGDLKTGLEQLGVTDDVTLVAHSQGGEVAHHLAQDDPELLSGAVLVDANLPQFFTDEEIPRLVAAARPHVEEAKKDPEKPENRQLLATADGFAAAHAAFHQVIWPDSVPATVIVSAKTPFDGSPVDAQRWRDAAAAFVQAGPGRRLVTAEGASHDVPAERPELVLAEIEAVFAARH